MKTMLKIIGLLALIASFLTGCNDELDLDQHGVLNLNTYYKTDQDAEEALTAVYFTFAQHSPVNLVNPEMSILYTKNLLSDDIWHGTDSHDGDFWPLNEYNFDSGHPIIEAMFNTYYTVIGKCNAVIDNVEGSTSVQQRVIAEAKVFRAWMYFDLVTLWGNPPIVDHLISVEEASIPNSNPAEVWTMIERDLTSAINSGRLMEKSNIDDNSIYHVTKHFAQAILGKAYLWQNKYNEAAEAFNNIIDSGLYGLYQGEYADIHMMWAENNRESMFEVNWIVDEANPLLCMRMYPMFINPNTSLFSLGANPFNLVSISFGGMQPQGKLYNAFVSEEGKNGYRLTSTIKTPDDMKKQGYTLNPGMQSWGENYFMYKLRYDADAMSKTIQLDCGNNTRWMRYAEVLLLAAEANLAAGNQTLADKYLNEVRSRAKLPAKSATLDAIKLEKRLELCGEGVRFQDLLRWGEAAAVLGEQGKLTPIMLSDGSIEWRQINSTYGFKDGKHNRLPYPAADMRMNKNLIQNPNW